MKHLTILIMITGGAYFLSVQPSTPAKKHHVCTQNCTKKKCDEANS